MKNSIKTALFVLVYFAVLTMSAQGTPEKTVNADVMVPHQELVYLHVNSNLLFVGEYLYYTLYCLQDTTGKLSDVSKIAYVKLVDENREVVLNHKIKLEQGIGESNFFVPSSIPSGNYKLIAYTQWMLNNGRDYYYSVDLTVLNPYTSDQAVFWNKGENDSVHSESQAIPSGTTDFLSNPPLQLELNGNNYATRAPISLKITSRTTEGSGNYSVSVKRVSALETEGKNSALEYRQAYPQKGQVEEQILPELRGTLFIGELTSEERVLSKENREIAVSFPGEGYLFKLASTDANGQFFINVEEDYTAQEVYLEVLAENENFGIELRSEEQVKLDALNFDSFKLDKGMESLIRQRSIYNQIENAYYSSKPDTILIAKSNDRFYGTGTMSYVLDEYTRFPSIKETFVEVVEHVWIQQNKNGKAEFHVRPIAPYVESGKLPMVFVDGLLVTDHERLINLAASQVESITISRYQHFYGTKAFQGVIDISTFNADFYQNYYNGKLSRFELFKPDQSKNYFRQSYEGSLKEEYIRLPDFRHQLLWLPKLEMTTKEETIEFYSSDLEGEFEISIEGFTKSGNPVSLKKNFWVGLSK